MRSPFSWVGFYLGGWLAARAREAIPWGRVGLAAFVVWLGLCALPYLVESALAMSQPWNAVLATLQNFAAILAIIGLARGPRISKPVLWLSGATYPLFLWHGQIIFAFKQTFSASEGGRLALFFLTLGLTAAFIAALRAIAPRAARIWVGA